MLDPHAIHIYTDGSCFRNPGGPSGCAARAEVPEHLCREEELLFTDSLYVKNGAMSVHEWRKHSGENRHGEPMENWDLWKEFLRVQAEARIRVDFAWMHDKSSPSLLRVHHDAKAAAKRGGTNIDGGYKPGWITRSKVKGTATRFKAAGQSTMIRPYRKKKMKNGEWKIRFDLLSDDGRGYAGCCYAYASPELTLGELHSQNGYRVRFNDNPNHPQIVEFLEKVELPK